MRWFEPEHTQRHTVAPNFSLSTPSGETVTRAQFRQKRHLVLLVYPAGADSATLGALASAHRELAQVEAALYVVVYAEPENAGHVPVLLDPEGTLRRSYAALFPATMPPLADDAPFILIINRYGVLEYVGCNLAQDATDAPELVARVWSVATQCSL